MSAYLSINPAKQLGRNFLQIFCVLVATQLLGQSEHILLKQADQAYTKQDYNKAEENYRKALEKKTSETTKYNLGNAIMEQNRPQEAIPYYDEAAKKQAQPDLKANALHNLGNAYFQQKEYDKSVAAYKGALKLKPSELDTKKNLALAKKQLLKQQQQQQEQQNKEQPKDQQSPQQDQQPQPPQNEAGKPKEQPQKTPNEGQPTQPNMTKEEADQLLQFMEREDQRVQQKLTTKNSKNNPPKKDW